MHLAETVTFGGSGLNRAAELRTDAAQSTLKNHPGARVTFFWRGKPLVCGHDPEDIALAWMALTHPILGPRETLLFLGLNEEGIPIFLVDISIWEPEEIPKTLDAFLDPSEQSHQSSVNAMLPSLCVSFSGWV